mmetsp:Transcript_171448/g.544549  ORF Transcript_171448/g.544549 Transcript_171448/m.544549 type:complete len:476 (+) Transcript_171448:456-1883(+)
MGLALPCAHVDVTVAGAEGAGTRPRAVLKQLAERLLERRAISRLELGESSRSPSMQVQHRSTGLWADISLDRAEGLEASAFVSAQLALFPALPPLLLLLKLFLEERGLLDASRGGLGSYVLFCLVLSFLQRDPSARDLRRQGAASLGNLLLGFFRHFGLELRFGAMGISLRDGGSLFDIAARGWTAPSTKGHTSLCLESPTSPDVDLGARIRKMGTIRAAFAHGYHALGSCLLTGAPPGRSLLCPQVLHARHSTIAQRYRLLARQPPPWPPSPGELDEGEVAAENGVSPPAKRGRLDQASAALANAVAQSIALRRGLQVQEPTGPAVHEPVELSEPADQPAPPVSAVAAATALAADEPLELDDSLGGVLDALVAAGGGDAGFDDMEPDTEGEDSEGEVDAGSAAAATEAAPVPAAAAADVEAAAAVAAQGGAAVAADDDQGDRAADASGSGEEVADGEGGGEEVDDGDEDAMVAD